MKGQAKNMPGLWFRGGRNRVRTCGPFRVKEVRSRCAIRPYKQGREKAALENAGSPGRIRTYNPPVNSRMLCH